MIDFLFQSTRPVRGATSWQSNSIIGFLISIHAPRAGRDPISTIANAVGVISIHAPRAGRDFDYGDFIPLGCNFNPRAPCGARP